MALLSSYLGLSTGLVSNPIGKDIEGKQISRFLDNFKIETNVIALSNSKTPLTVVFCDNDENLSLELVLRVRKDRNLDANCA